MTRSEDYIPSDIRMILNANPGVTNIIEHDVIRRDMGKVTDSIFQKLKAHYGPYSSFAGLDANKPLEDTVFTKDGKNIINAIEFASPLEDWVRRAIAYIGKNIEKAAGDGTTSSMMFACSMLKHMTATLDEIRPLSYNQFYDDWKKFVNLVKTELKDYTLSHKNSNGEINIDKVKEMAHLQAYTSSHGNTELAKAVARMFECTPPDMWGKMQFGRRLYENTKLFEVVETQGQYSMDANILSKTVFNKDVGQYLEYENATLIIVNDVITVGSVHWKKIRETIEASTTEKPVAILCHNSFDNATFGELMDLTKETVDGKRKHTFAVFGFNPIHSRVNDFAVLQTITGHNPIEFANDGIGMPCFVEGVYVKYINDKLEFDHLYKDDRPKVDQIRTRPGYMDSATPYFNDFADTIKKFIESLEDSQDLSRQQQIELKSLKTMYNKLVYDKSVFLLIGGNTFDNLAMFDVVDDVIRATIRSLENGMVVSNNKSLYWAVETLHAVFKKKPPRDKSPSERRMEWFAKNILKTLNEFSDVVLDQLYPKGKKTIEGSIPTFSLLGRLMHKINLCDPSAMFGQHNADYSIPSQEEIDFAYRFTREERDSFREWWFNNAVNMLRYDNTKMWDDQAYEYHSTKKQVRRHSYNKDNMIVQPANADIVMLERFGEIALKFILTERVIVKGSAYLNKEKK